MEETLVSSGLDMETIILLVVATVSGALLPTLFKLIKSVGMNLLGMVKESDNLIDDKLLVTVMEEAHKQGIISEKLLTKVKNELRFDN